MIRLNLDLERVTQRRSDHGVYCTLHIWSKKELVGRQMGLRYSTRFLLKFTAFGRIGFNFK